MNKTVLKSEATRPAAPSQDDGALRTEVYRGLEGLRRLVGDWEQVAGKQFRQRFFHWHSWYESCLEHLIEDADAVHFFVVRRGVTALAIVPLEYCAHRLLGKRIRRWRLPRHPHMPLADLLCAAGISMDDLRQALLPALREQLDGWDVIEFPGLLEESALATNRQAFGKLAVTTVEKTCDQVECSGSFDDIKGRFSKNFRSNLNKARNKLKRYEDVRTASLSLQPQLQGAFEEFLALEASGWKGSDGAGTAIELHPELVDFYQSMVDGMQGNVVVNSLYVDGRLIAGQFCLRDRDTLYILKLAYDERYSRLAPGNMLLEHVIRRGIETGEWRYVNLVGNPDWFRAWAPESQNMYTLRLCNRTPGGLLLRTAVRAKVRLAPLYRWYRENLADRRWRQR